MADSEKRQKRKRAKAGEASSRKKRARKRKPSDDRNLVAALNHKVRRKMLRHLHRSEEPLSPAKLAPELDMNLTNVSYHMDVLRKCGAAGIVEEVRVRGATEHFYASKVADNSGVRAMLDETEPEDEAES